MKRIVLALLLPLAACSGERATPADFYAVAPQVLRFMEQDARANQPGRVNDGPLYVNLESFRAASEAVTGTVLNQDSISRAVGEPTQAVLEQVLLCDTGDSISTIGGGIGGLGGIGGCWVRKYGIWVNWNLAHGTPDRINASVRSTTTDRRRRPTDFCDRVWRLTFRKQGTTWSLAEKELIADCRIES